MIKEIIRDIEGSVFNVKIDMLKHYIVTEINATKRKQAKTLLVQYEIASLKITEEITNLEKRFSFQNTISFNDISEKLHNDYLKSEQFFHSIEHMSNVLNVDRRDLTDKMILNSKTQCLGTSNPSPLPLKGEKK